MTSPPPPGADGGARRPERVNLGRALVILVVAVVGGVLLLGVAARPPANPTAPGPAASSTTTTTVNARATTTTTAPVVKADVAVQVANGSSVAGVAGDLTTTLKGEGWNALPAINTTNGEDVATSAVYYAAGQQTAAAQIAASLHLTPSAVQPLTTSAPVATTNGIDVLVVIGTDIAATVAGTS